MAYVYAAKRMILNLKLIRANGSHSEVLLLVFTLMKLNGWLDKTFYESKICSEKRRNQDSECLKYGNAKPHAHISESEFQRK